MPEAMILEFTGVTEAEYTAVNTALAAGGVTAYPKVQWVPLVAYHQPGA
ncbi:MAG: hypothetical protein ACRDOD_11830 [Streptosporangiaceae bacterium]